ncbi:hypothetical protein NXT3_CH01647 [Sinorhizobium fredii]|uniref:Uncharacterized protein n=1 Tax=Rhizobium fredii TaxID=380 RepID=A0A2L0H4V5_RHIFR|nr:hypothetical protein NXT3_CH01647 [Sinorhizobium fredii]
MSSSRVLLERVASEGASDKTADGLALGLAGDNLGCGQGEFDLLEEKKNALRIPSAAVARRVVFGWFLARMLWASLR